MVYEMLTGAMPFVKPTKSDVIAAILTETPPPLTNLRDDAPPELQRIVAKSLQKKRDDRYQTSRDLLLDLKSLGKELELTGQANRATRPTQTETGAHTTGPLSTRRFSLAQTLGLLLLAGLAVSAAWWFIARRNAQNFTPSSLKTAEAASWRSAPGEVYSTGSFSPDGSRVAFVTNASGSPNIYVKQTNANTPPVPATKDEFRNEQPIWSPDGEEIAFFSTRGGQPGLWRVAYLGGSPTLIKNVAAGNTRPCHWAKSGAFYYEEKQNLFAFDLQSGQTTQVTNFEAAKPYSLNISPDEKQVVYITAEGERWSVWAAPARGGAARQIVNSAAEIRNTVWHSDSQRILYSSLNDGVFQIFVTDGGPPAQITFGDRDSFALDVTADGGKILYGSSKEESDVWGFNLATNEEFALTSDINSELWPAIAPDNKTVAFLSIKNLSQGDKLASGAIMTKPADADTPPAQLAANGYLPAWSPDGKQLAFMRVAGKVYNLWTVKAVGGAEKQLTKDGALTANQSLLPYNRTQTSEFSWSPDASRIVYRSQKTGAQNLWLVAADGAGDTQLTNNSDANIEFHSPLWSPDGKFIVYTAKPNKAVDGKFIYRAQVLDLATKETKEVFQAEQFLRLLGWSEDGKGLIVAVRKSNNTGSSLTEVNLLEASLASGASRAIATQPSTYLYNLHLSADGRMIAYVSQQDGKDNLWLLPARGGVARKLTANNDASLYFSSLAWSPDGRLICFGKQSRFSLLSMITNFKG
jgi:Tol biopolymer transport system component